MNFCTVFAIFVFIGSTFNVDTEPIFHKPMFPSGGIQKNKRIIVKHGTKHSGHRGHRKPLPSTCVSEPVNTSSSQPVTAISEPSISEPITPGPSTSEPLTSEPLTTEPDIFFPGTVVGPVIIDPDGSSSVTTATTGAATTFVPGM